MSDSILILPRKIVCREGSASVAVDFGGTSLKVVHTKNIPNSEVCEVHTKLFPRRAVDRAVRFVADIVRGLDVPVLHATGVWSGMYQRKLTESTCARLVLFDELTSFVGSFNTMLTAMPKHKMVYQRCEEAISAAEEIVKDAKAVVKVWAEESTSKWKILDKRLSEEFWKVPCPEVKPNKPYSQADKDLFPCLYVFGGGASGMMKISADGSSEYVALAPRTGSCLMGMSSIFLGIKDQDELMEVASRGDSSVLDIRFSDLQAGWEDTAYSAGMATDEILFNFGKGADSNMSDWRKEDLARALLDHVLHDLAQTVCTNAEMEGVSRVFYAGGMFMYPLVRHDLTKLLYTRRWQRPQFKIEHNFLRSGVHYGAIGALMGKNP